MLISPASMLSPYWSDPILHALYAKAIVLGAPVPGIDPHGPLTHAIFSIQLLEQLAMSTPNARHKESLLNIAKEILAESIRVITE